VLSRYPEVVNPAKKLPEVKHTVEHFIQTKGRPVTAKIPPPGRGKVGSGEGGVSADGEGRHYLLLEQSLGQPTPHGPKERWDLEALRRLSPVECGDGAG
jgi:hypothetical protein